MKFTLLNALLGVAAAGLVVDEEKGSYLTAEHLQTVEDALAAHATAAGALATTTTERDAARTALATVTTERDAATTKLATYANVPAETSAAPVQKHQDDHGKKAEAQPWDAVNASLTSEVEQLQKLRQFGN